MLEIKVNIEAQDLSQAITQLALAIKGDVVEAVPGQPELVIPAGTPMTVTNVQPAAEAPAPGPQPVNPVPAEAQPVQSQTPVNTVPAQQPVMNAPTAPALDLDTISRAGAALVDQGKMNDVLKILQEKYGIFAVTQLVPEQFASFADDLRALGADI